MAISMIAAIGKNNEIGKNNDLIWHFSEDMKFFKKTTTGKTVVMGRKTFESLPHALPNRRNIVITTNADYVAEGAEIATSVEQAIKMTRDEEVFVIGGGKIYAKFLPVAETLYVTEIDAKCPDADAYFPRFNRNAYFCEQLTDYTVDGINFKHMVYTKK